MASSRLPRRQRLRVSATARERDADATLEALLALDPNHDGKLTVVELRTIAKRAFNRVDTDGDTQISAAEYMPLAEQVREIQALRSAPQCELPPVPHRAKLVVYGGCESDAISSVAVAGPEQETNFMDVVVEPGAMPFYLVLTSYESMVWRLSGSTDRVVRVVVSSLNTARSGVLVTANRQSERRIPSALSRAEGI